MFGAIGVECLGCRSEDVNLVHAVPGVKIGFRLSERFAGTCEYGRLDATLDNLEAVPPSPT